MKRWSALVLFVFPIRSPLVAAADSPAYQDGILTKVRTTVVDNCLLHFDAIGRLLPTATPHAAPSMPQPAALTSAAQSTPSRWQAQNTSSLPTTPASREHPHTFLSARLILKQSSLANHMPGTAVKLRRDDEGFLVLVGKRESHYRVFVAH